jgi:hypothetical protein
MKLSPAQVHRVQQQIGGQVISSRHALSPQLQRAFGNHTFFLDSEGLNIVEPSPADSQVGNVVKLASWVDDEHSTLEPNPPEPKPVVVQLGSPGTNGEDRD